MSDHREHSAQIATAVRATVRGPADRAVRADISDPRPASRYPRTRDDLGSTVSFRASSDHPRSHSGVLGGVSRGE